MLEAQTPAEGILKRNDWGDTKCYQIVCNCGDSDHDHNIWIEADDHEVSVIIYTTNTTPFWSKRRWRQMWELLTQGCVKQEVAISMTEQQALNYANVLTSAVEDVKIFKSRKLEDK